MRRLILIAFLLAACEAPKPRTATVTLHKSDGDEVISEASYVGDWMIGHGVDVTTKDGRHISFAGDYSVTWSR